MSYEAEQARLLRMLEELEAEENTEFDDNEDEGEVDHVNEREDDSDTEQELDIEDEETMDTGRFFLGKDKVTKWRKQVPPQNVRTRSKNIITHLPGVTSATKGLKSVVDIWNYFFDDEIITIIVENTNKVIETISNNYDRSRNANSTNVLEIRALLGLLYLSGVRKCNHLNARDLWRTDGTSLEIFRLTMSNYRFQFLLQHVRFDDKATRADRLKFDNLAPIRKLFDAFVIKCKNGYCLSEYVTIDEKLEAFRGNCRFRQYIPSKPNKYGIKIFALADAKLFYVSNLEIYVGTQPDGPYATDNRPALIVERMCQPIYGSKRNVTIDNWFTSKELVDKLLKEYKLTVVGTIRKNKKQLPIEFVNGKGREVNSSLFSFQENSTLVSYIPRKGKIVLLLSTLHNDDKIDSNTGKPEIIITYNETKSGVDVLDKLCASYNCARPTRRWPMVIFYSIMNMAAINSLVIYGINNPNLQNIIRRDFLHDLSFELISDFLKEHATSNYIPRSLRSRIKEICHLEAEVTPLDNRENTIGRCCYCDSKKNRKTKYFCKACGKYMCLGHVTVVCDECYAKTLSE